MTGLAFGGGGGGGGGADTIARATATAAKTKADEISLDNGAIVPAGEVTINDGKIWRNDTAGALTVNEADMAGAGFTEQTQPVQVDEVVLSATALVGAAPSGAKEGRLTVAPFTEYVNNGGVWVEVSAPTVTEQFGYGTALPAASATAPLVFDVIDANNVWQASFVRVDDGANFAWKQRPIAAEVVTITSVSFTLGLQANTNMSEPAFTYAGDPNADIGFQLRDAGDAPIGAAQTGSQGSATLDGNAGNYWEINVANRDQITAINFNGIQGLGAAPADFGVLSALTDLDVSGNAFDAYTGTVPSGLEVFSWTNCNTPVLDLSAATGLRVIELRRTTRARTTSLTIATTAPIESADLRGNQLPLADITALLQAAVDGNFNGGTIQLNAGLNDAIAGAAIPLRDELVNNRGWTVTE